MTNQDTLKRKRRELQPGLSCVKRKLLLARNQWRSQCWCCTGGGFMKTGKHSLIERRAKNDDFSLNPTGVGESDVNDHNTLRRVGCYRLSLISREEIRLFCIDCDGQKVCSMTFNSTFKTSYKMDSRWMWEMHLIDLWSHPRGVSGYQSIAFKWRKRVICGHPLGSFSFILSTFTDSRQQKKFGDEQSRYKSSSQKIRRLNILQVCLVGA